MQYYAAFKRWGAPFKENAHSRKDMGHPLQIVQTTLPGTWNEAEVGDFAHRLLEQGSACIHIQRIRSVYRWEGELQSENEWLLQFKTDEIYEAVLREAIASAHPYDTPQIISWPASANSDYYVWAQSTLNRE